MEILQPELQLPQPRFGGRTKVGCPLPGVPFVTRTGNSAFRPLVCVLLFVVCCLFASTAQAQTFGCGTCQPVVDSHFKDNIYFT